jgi:putative SOS response-associated peptidase YedK
MCGRYTLVAGDEEQIAEFDLGLCEPVTPNRNNRPTDLVPVIRLPEEESRRSLQHLRWGLIPSWSKDPKTAYKMINARSEEAAAKPAFRDAFRRRRCLVPCSGFYEWKAAPGAPKSARKEAFVFGRPDHRLFALAGLWDRWLDAEGKPVETFAILTRAADETVSPIHDRMPVIMDKGHYEEWLGREARIDDIQRLCTAAFPNLICESAEGL